MLHLESNGPDLASLSLVPMSISKRNVGYFAFLEAQDFPMFEESFRKRALFCIVFALRHSVVVSYIPAFLIQFTSIFSLRSLECNPSKPSGNYIYYLLLESITLHFLDMIMGFI
jgi:hypothetical protein